MPGGSLLIWRYSYSMADDQTPLSTLEQRTSPVPWPPVLLATMVAVAYVLGNRWPLPWPGTGDAAARWTGLGFGAAGLILIIAGVMALRSHNTTVMPHGRAATLVTAGPYRFLRNPIYLGEAFLMFGLAEITKNVWFVPAGLVFALLITMLQIMPEERHLEARFDDAYRDYKSRTRRWI